MNYDRIIAALNKSSYKVLIFMTIIMVMYLYKDEVSLLAKQNLYDYDRVTDVLDTDVLINSSLTNLMNEYEADRAYIFIFHNGVTYYSGGHKNKMSCDYEVTNSGISSTANELQDIPVTLYPDFVLGCVNDLMYYPSIDSLKEGRLKKALQAQGISGIAVAPYYRDDKLVCLIGLDFIKGCGYIDRYDFAKIKYFKNKINGIGELIM